MIRSMESSEYKSIFPSLFLTTIKNYFSFTYKDSENLEFVLQFCSSVIANTLAFQREMTLKKQNQALLQVAKNLFSRLNDLNTLFREIMNEAKGITKAERYACVNV